jgi:glycosyltransferase involved in cell wall biosynthesis
LKLALSALCENATRRTGLTTLFEELVDRSLRLYEGLRWIVFVAEDYPWGIDNSRVEIVKVRCSTQDVKRRIWFDHIVVPARAGTMGAAALVTVGFVPLRKCLPVVAHILSFQHQDSVNGVGKWRSAYRAMMVRRAALQADLVITNSKWAASQLLRSYPGCGDRTLISYEGVDHNRFCVAKGPHELERLYENFGLMPGYFLWVSNFYPYKQADTLIKAYARLDGQIRQKAPLVMVGGGWDDGANSAMALAKVLGVASDVKFLGWVSDEWLPTLYRNAVAFCHPSRDETFGRAVVEAMACGVPCVVNDIPVMREISGGHASFAAFGDSEAGAAALRAIWQEASLREDLRQRGIQQASRFSFDALARERLEAIFDLVSKRWRSRSGGRLL